MQAMMGPNGASTSWKKNSDRLDHSADTYLQQVVQNYDNNSCQTPFLAFKLHLFPVNSPSTYLQLHFAVHCSHGQFCSDKILHLKCDVFLTSSFPGTHVSSYHKELCAVFQSLFAGNFCHVYADEKSKYTKLTKHSMLNFSENSGKSMIYHRCN